MRESAPGPMLRTYAVRASMASMSRKSSSSPEGLASRCQFAPPSAVRTIVLPAPLAHATCVLTALTPRRRTATLDVWVVQVGACPRNGPSISNGSNPLSTIDSRLYVCAAALDEANVQTLTGDERANPGCARNLTSF